MLINNCLAVGRQFRENRENKVRCISDNIKYITRVYYRTCITCSSNCSDYGSHVFFAVFTVELMRLLKKLSECESMAVANPNQNHPTCLLKNTNLSPKLKKVYAGIKSPRPYSDRKSEQSEQMNEKS